TYRVRGIGPGPLNCVGDYQNIVISINPEPVATNSLSILNVERCSGVNINYDLQDAINGIGGNSVDSRFTYTVVADNLVGLSPLVFPGVFDRLSPSDAPITTAFTNLSANPIVLTYTVTPFSEPPAGCQGSNFVVKVTILPQPVGVDFTEPTCDSGLNHNIQAKQINVIGGNFLNSIFTYTVSSSDEAAVPTPAGLDRTVANNLPITDTFVNLSGTDVVVTYTITPYNANAPQSCAGAPILYEVVVSAKPVGFDFVAAPVCSDVPFDIDPQDVIDDIGNGGNGVTSTFTWTANYGTPGNLTVNNTPPPATDTNLNGRVDGALTNKTNGQKFAIYTITPTSGSCVGPTFNITVPIDPEPVLDAAVINTPICSDTPFDFDLAPTAGTVSLSNFDVTLVSVHPDLTPNPGNTFFEAPVGPVSLINQPATIIRNEQYTNNKRSSSLFVEYSVTGKSETTPGLVCVGDNLKVVMEILAEPVMNPALANLVVCSDAPTDILLEPDGLTPTPTSFFINSATVQGTNIGLPGTVVGDVTAAAGNKTIVPTNQVGKDFLRSDKFTVKHFDIADPISVRTVVYNVTPQVGVCLGDPFDINLEIKPEPVLLATIDPDPICSDDQIDVTLGKVASSVDIDRFRVVGVTWDNLLVKGSSNANVGDVFIGMPSILQDTYTNTTSLIRNATYTVVPITEYVAENLVCEGDPDGTIVIPISPAPAVAEDLNNIVCSDTESEIVIRDTESVNSNGISAQSFVISRSVATGLVVNNAPVLDPFYNGTDNITVIENDRFENPTNAPLDVVYTVRAWTGTNATLCESPEKEIVLTVEPTIVATPVNNSAEICSGALTAIEMQSPTLPTAGDVTFNVTIPSPPSGITGFSALSGLIDEPGAEVEQLLNNNNTVPTTIQYRVVPRAASAAGGTPGCTGAAVFVNVTVQPKPNLIAISNKTICEDDAVGIALSTTTSPTVGAGYGSVEYELLSPVSNPIGTISGNSVAGAIFTTSGTLTDVLNTSSLNQDVITYSFSPRFAVPASVINNTPLSGFCVGNVKDITVTVSPRAQISPLTNVEVCSGSDPFSQNINVVDADPSSTLITWTRVTNPSSGISGASGGAGDVITQTLFNSTNDIGTVTYTFTPRSFNCTGSPVNLVATVLPSPKLQNVPSSFNICNDADFEINLDNFSPTTNATFRWTIEDPFVPGIRSGNGLTIDDTWSNILGNLATATYTITPLVLKTDGSECPGSEKIVSVNIAPQVSATLFSSTGDNDDYLCEGGKGFLFFENTGLPSFDMTYRVDNGTTTNDISLTKQGIVRLQEVQPSVTTTYTILSVKDAFGCEFVPTTDNVVVVNVGNTDANFSIVGDPINCSPFPVDFKHSQQNGVVYNWKWFDGEPDSTYTANANVTDQIVRHTFFNPAPGSTVRYKVFLETTLADVNYPGGCFKTTFKEVQVYPTVATAIFPDKTEICSGEEVRFVNTSQGVRQDKWFYRVQGSGGELEPRTGSYTPPQRPATSQVYNIENITSSDPLVIEVVYQASNLNCPAADVVIPITVYRGVTANFDNTVPTEFVGGHSFVNITNTSTPIDPVDFTYEWNFGTDANPASLNGTTPPNPIDYTTPGSKEITLLVTNIDAMANGLVCASEIRKTIEIIVPPLLANFKAFPLATCYPSDITILENLATGDEFEWTVIDGAGRIFATSNANLPVFAIPNPGRYSIVLITRNSFTGQQSPPSIKDIEIFENPIASFEVRPTTVFIPDQAITTFNFSDGANQYDWDFGDGNTSIDFEPKITYKVEGDYPITLVAGFNNGSRDIDGDGVSDGNIVCYDTATRTVQARDGGLTRIPNSFTPNPNGPGGNGGNGGAGSFNDVFLPITKGVEEFMMQIFDRWGTLVFESRDKNQGWDGYDKNGNLVPAGVYVYKLELRLSNGDRTTQVGDITLIR
ncbi:MAG: hypothetical protein EBR30_18175, partial [Cytophagia bacterium]|nr:hypothetical protein [Cytophagia bacterium]